MPRVPGRHAELLLALVVACGSSAPRDPLDDFTRRVRAYVDVERHAEAELPPPAQTVDPGAVQARRTALAVKVRAALPEWRAGSLFTPAIGTALRARLAKVLAGDGGRDARGVIFDDNPGRVRAAALADYPDGVALSSVPAGVLAALPALPDDLEYRFAGHDLILRDTRANLVVDVLEAAIR